VGGTNGVGNFQGTNSTYSNNTPNYYLPPPAFSLSLGARQIDPALEQALVNNGTLSRPPRIVRRVPSGHQKYPPLAPRIMQPSPLSERSTADLGQSPLAEQAEAIRIFGALSGPQIVGLPRDKVADVYFLHALQNNSLGPFGSRQAFDERVLSAYAASQLSDEAPSVATMLSQFQNLNAAIQTSAADYRQAYPGTSEEFLRHALWQSWRPAWQGVAAGAQSYPTDVTSSQLHETAQSAQQAQQILNDYAMFGPQHLAGIGDVSGRDHRLCISGGVFDWPSVEMMEAYAVRGAEEDYWTWNWPFTTYVGRVPWVNLQHNLGGIFTLATENFLRGQRVLVGPTGYRDPSGRVLGTFSPINRVTAAARVNGANGLIRRQRDLRTGRRC
jgi:hypothetical protein